MTRICVLAVLPSLFALSLSGDTLELKTGERIEGAFKQANLAGAVIEVGGQAITIPLEKVRAIYFGGAPARTGVSPAPSRDALDALKALQSVTKCGIAYRDYVQRVLDARVKVDQYLSVQPNEGNELRAAIRVAMLEYELASWAWAGHTTGEYGDMVKPMASAMQYPEVAKCHTVAEAIEKVDHPPARTPSRDRILERALAELAARPRDTRLVYELIDVVGDNPARGIWGCASAQVTEAERLLTPAGQPPAQR